MFALKYRVKYLKEILFEMSDSLKWPSIIKGKKDDKIIDIINEIFKDYIEEEITEDNKYEIFIKYNFLNLVNFSKPNSTNIVFNLFMYYFDPSCFKDDFIKYICENKQAHYFHKWISDDIYPLYIDIYNLL